MKWRYLVALAAIAGTATVLQAHDFFFRANRFFVTPGATVFIRALNGTFSKSENSITRDRLRDLSVVGPGGRGHPDTAAWSTTGDASVLTVKAGAQGTYVVGASLKPREITLKADDFNHYLADDGIPDVLALRRKKGEMRKDATERYSKHIKAILQVGNKRDGAYSTILGYPAELVPLDNPYSVKAGGMIRVRSMVDGKPAANQLIVSGGRNQSGGRFPERRVRSDKSGIARIPISKKGQWYVKFIHMVPFVGAEKIDYESKWATLTFEVR